MASYDYEIVNLALVRLGSVRITSLSDGSRNANEANAIYSMVRDEVLRSHPWKFATRRASLELKVENVLTITGITEANPGVLTYTGTDPADGDQYLIESIVGMTELNDTTVMIHDVSTGGNTFKLYDMEGNPINTTTYTAWSSGGTCTEVVPLSDEFSYLYVLPSDCLRVIAINDDRDIEFEIDENGLMCNEDEVEALYIKQITDVTKFSPDFVDTLAWRLAQDLAIVVTGSIEKMKAAAIMLEKTMARATAHDASEKRTDYPTFSRYKSARR